MFEKRDLPDPGQGFAPRDPNVRLLPSKQRRTKELITVPNPILTAEALDIEALMVEISSYLTAVEVFRAESHEPCWN